jgi:hypothetical protein
LRIAMLERRTFLGARLHVYCEFKGEYTYLG